MAIARVYHLTCDCCGTHCPAADSRAGAKTRGRTRGWRIGEAASKSALCPRCIPIGHDRTHCLEGKR